MGIFPVQATIPEQSKWTNRANALPKENTIVTLAGSLVAVEREPRDGRPVRFIVSVERHLDWIGRRTVSASPTKTPGK